MEESGCGGLGYHPKWDYQKCERGKPRMAMTASTEDHDGPP